MSRRLPYGVLVPGRLDEDVEIVPLDEQVTLRVVNYRRRGTNADIANRYYYVTDATYVTVKEDEHVVLQACAISE